MKIRRTLSRKMTTRPQRSSAVRWRAQRTPSSPTEPQLGQLNNLSPRAGRLLREIFYEIKSDWECPRAKHLGFAGPPSSWMNPSSTGPAGQALSVLTTISELRAGAALEHREVFYEFLVSPFNSLTCFFEAAMLLLL